jgi:Bacteriocin-protection, YdeI or OmpD-Associated
MQWPIRRSSALLAINGTGAPFAKAVATLGEASRLLGHLLINMGQKATAATAVHRLPADFRKAIESDPIVKDVWADITPLARNEWICWVTSAAKDETRSRRITVGLDKMRKGMRRPCCWPGCPHR